VGQATPVPAVGPACIVAVGWLGVAAGAGAVSSVGGAAGVSRTSPDPAGCRVSVGVWPDAGPWASGVASEAPHAASVAPATASAPAARHGHRFSSLIVS